jgi:hypothetical protein
MATRTCSERGRLLNLYSHATAQLGELLVPLTELTNRYEDAAFNLAWERYAKARDSCSQIQRQLYEHMGEHRCGQGHRRGQEHRCGQEATGSLL